MGHYSRSDWRQKRRIRPGIGSFVGTRVNPVTTRVENRRATGDTDLELSHGYALYSIRLMMCQPYWLVPGLYSAMPISLTSS